MLFSRSLLDFLFEKVFFCVSKFPSSYNYKTFVKSQNSKLFFHWRLSFWPNVKDTTFFKNLFFNFSDGLKLELVSKELDHFEGIASFFLDWAPGTVTGGA